MRPFVENVYQITVWSSATAWTHRPEYWWWVDYLFEI